MTKRPKIKLKYVPGKVNSVEPESEFHCEPAWEQEKADIEITQLKQLVVKLGLCLVASKAQIEKIRDEMKYINPNIHPIKWQTKANWELGLDHIVKQINFETAKVPQLYNESEAAA